MSDNGAAMLAAETVQGLEDLGVLHETTLAHSPYQNGKQEAFWSQIESRLMAMLEGVEQLTLAQLNEATQAWVELEYNKKPHQAFGVSPVHRYLDGPEVGRPSPSSDTLRDAFRCKQWRTQRRSDGTLSIEGHRFEVPSRWRNMTRVMVRYARWDLSHIDIVDPHTGNPITPVFPQDKQRNADARRRALTSGADAPPPRHRHSDIAPVLEHLLREYAASGLPPAYLPKPPHPDADNEDD